MQKTIIITGIVVASLLMIWIIIGYVSLANVKEPDYKVIEKKNICTKKINKHLFMKFPFKLN